MIGVVSYVEEHTAIEEFFELFKTPWEFYEPDNQYDVLLVTRQDVPTVDVSLIIVYSTETCSLDVSEVVDGTLNRLGACIQWHKEKLPIYGHTVTLPKYDGDVLLMNCEGAPVGYEIISGHKRILRIGYNLFFEVSHLLSVGQPPQNAMIPTLDLHIAMLRRWIVETGLTLVEIPPVPEGYDFSVCLTHDIDFIGIRRHFLDHSMLGFLYRATLGSLLDYFKRKISLSMLSTNIRTACSLPLVYLGICRDPWDQFDRCLNIEDGLPSTFFFIPFKNRAGKGFSEGRAKRRATKYDINDAGTIVQKLVARGCEIGVHGIDAWHDIKSAEQELQRIEAVASTQDGIGIRMHWLCWNERTFEILDKAGYSYDSTVGYNDTVGFKAGSTQPFKPIGMTHLLELPLHIQDTALFRKGGLFASEEHADELCQRIIDHVKSHGGVLTVLWHQRSLGPERLWDSFYVKLLEKIKKEKAWVATAREISEWFRMRRSATFETYGPEAESVRVVSDEKDGRGLPRLVMRSFARREDRASQTQPVNDE